MKSPAVKRLTPAQKENAALKAELVTCAAKIEEYRKELAKFANEIIQLNARNQKLANENADNWRKIDEINSKHRQAISETETRERAAQSEAQQFQSEVRSLRSDVIEYALACSTHSNDVARIERIQRRIAGLPPVDRMAVEAHHRPY